MKDYRGDSGFTETRGGPYGDSEVQVSLSGMRSGREGGQKTVTRIRTVSESVVGSLGPGWDWEE